MPEIVVEKSFDEVDKIDSVDSINKVDKAVNENGHGNGKTPTEEIQLSKLVNIYFKILMISPKLTAVYFHEKVGASHAICWSKSSFSAFNIFLLQV